LWFWWVIAILLAPGCLIGLLLAVPVDVALDLEIRGKPKFQTHIRWLFGLVNFNPGVRTVAVKPGRPAGRKTKTARRTHTSGAGVGLATFLDILYTPGLWKEIKMLLARLFQSFRIRELAGEITAGLPDPAGTGILYGLFTAATVPFGGTRLKQIRFIPSFDGYILEGWARGVITVQPIRPVIAILLFLLSPPGFGVLKTLVKDAWKRRPSKQVAGSLSVA
jgi:hypothetical protein